MCPCLPRGRMSTTYATSMSRNDRKCKYIPFVLSEKNRVARFLSSRYKSTKIAVVMENWKKKSDGKKWRNVSTPGRVKVFINRHRLKVYLWCKVYKWFVFPTDTTCCSLVHRVYQIINRKSSGAICEALKTADGSAHRQLQVSPCLRMQGRQKVYFLTHWGRDKMATISQTTFSNAFSWMKLYEFRLRFHWSLFLRLQSKIFEHWFR